MEYINTSEVPFGAEGKAAQFLICHEPNFTGVNRRIPTIYKRREVDDEGTTKALTCFSTRATQ